MRTGRTLCLLKILITAPTSKPSSRHFLFFFFFFFLDLLIKILRIQEKIIVILNQKSCYKIHLLLKDVFNLPQTILNLRKDIL